MKRTFLPACSAAAKSPKQPITALCTSPKCFARLHTQHPPEKYRKPRRRKVSGIAIFAAVGFVGTLYYNSQLAYAEAPAKEKTPPTFRLSEIQEHGRDAETQWVTRGTKVYDITEWIPAHPGGDIILRAVGGDINRFWDIFAIHKKQDVYDILAMYYIGEVDPRDLVDGKIPADSVEDPFVNDPKRDKRLLVLTEKPCNAESPQEALQTFITPNETHYVRQHLWVPELDPAQHTLLIELPDGTEKEYTLAELKSKFPPVTVTATLQCSGNRRSHMSQSAQPALGLQWGIGAISTSEWTGVRLRDVLADAGFDVDEWDDESVKHAQFVGDEMYGASIPIDKACARRGDVLLAYEMGGQPIPPDHGYPLRALVPGTVAARSVKWLRKIILSDEESSSQWQQRDYKCFGPNQGQADVDWATAPAIQEMPVQSAITALRELNGGGGGSSSNSSNASAEEEREMLKAHGIEDGEAAVQLEGYAFAGGGREIVRVDVSADGGKTWSQAELLAHDAKGSKAWSWKRWRHVVPRKACGDGQGGEEVFVVKAIDEAYNTQPDSYASNYNFRGNLTSSWHRIALNGDVAKEAKAAGRA